jgi:hypothetical protein
MIDRTFDPNLAMLETATETLGELCDSLVFIGGCATGLLLTASRAHSIRATKDIDVVTKVATIRDYHTVEKKLAERGFQHDTSPDAPICRWIGRHYARCDAIRARIIEFPQSLVPTCRQQL